MPPSKVRSLNKCRICGNASLVPCFDLGDQYLSSIFPEDLDYRSKLSPYPLRLVICEKNDSSCGLVQLADEIDLTEMYVAYPYTSSTNSSMSRVLQDVADSAKLLRHLKPKDLVLDIGCNDGTLLTFFEDQGLELLGIDAAQNIEPKTKSYAHVRGFFNADIFSKHASKKAKLVFSIAMFYHLHDPVGFSQEAAACLDNEGVWVVQMVYLPTMLKTNMYDNIVHEHNGYYGLHQMKWIMEKAGLEIFDVSLNDVYGGSFRVFIKKKGCHQFPITNNVEMLLREEENMGIFGVDLYRAFNTRIDRTRTDLGSLCAKIKKEGKSLWIYGASTKGNTILQFCGLDQRHITAAADSNPFKIGKYMIGSDIPIVDEAKMRLVQPDYLLALPYSFINGFLNRESTLIGKGTRFILPLPEVCLKP